MADGENESQSSQHLVSGVTWCHVVSDGVRLLASLAEPTSDARCTGQCISHFQCCQLWLNRYLVFFSGTVNPSNNERVLVRSKIQKREIEREREAAAQNIELISRWPTGLQKGCFFFLN